MIHEQNIGFQIRTLHNLIKRDVEASPPYQETRASGVHGWAIGYLNHNRDRDIFQKDFEEEFSVRRSTASNILKLMENKGLITRESVEGDARLKKIVLTPKATEIYHRIMEDIRLREERLAKDIPKEELEVFFRVLDKIKNNLEEAYD